MKKITAALILATSFLAPGSAVAAVEFLLTTINGGTGGTSVTIDTATVTFSSSDPSPFTGLSAAWIDVKPPTEQNVADIQTGVNNVINPDFNGTITSVSGGGLNSFSYDPAGIFDYIVVHVGDGTLLVRFLQSISQVTITTSGTGNGISNVFTFAGPNEVPLPGAIWLLGTALLGFVGLSRRKAISAA